MQNALLRTKGTRRAFVIGSAARASTILTARGKAAQAANRLIS
jgi:hypothetical protein